MRVLHTLGVLEDMSSAEAQEHADRHSAERWDPVVAELAKLEAASVNRAPVVNTQADNYADFVGKRNAPRGVQIFREFKGIFSDPDGDELTYAASIPADVSHLVDILKVSRSVSSNSGEKLDLVWILVDADDDWKAASPALADPLTITATLTATDPDGLSASVSGDFLTDWDSSPSLVSATANAQAVTLTYDQAVQSDPAPTPGQFTVNVANEDGSTGTVGVSGVSVNGTVVTLEMASALAEGQTVTVDYTHDDDTPLQRAGGGDAAPGFTGQTIVVSLPDPLVDPPGGLSATRLTASQLRLTWHGHPSARYEVQYREIDAENDTVGDWMDHSTTDVGASQADVGDLSCRLSYDFRVRATRDGATGPFATLNAVDTVLDGTQGSDSIAGSNSDECIRGGDGNDVLRGNQGNDLLEGGDGDDILYGGDGSSQGVDGVSGQPTAAAPAPTPRRGAPLPRNIAFGGPVGLMHHDTNHGHDAVTPQQEEEEEAKTPVKLVGNVDKSDAGVATLENDHLQPFTTGDNVAGYTLTRVDLKFASSGTAPTFSVNIMSGSFNNLQDHGALTQVGDLPGTAGLVQFNAPEGGIALYANTEYYLLIDVTADPNSNTTIDRTGAKTEDDDGATGWSIADFRYHTPWTSDIWSHETSNVLKLAVHGHLESLDDDNRLRGGNDNDHLHGGRGEDTLYGEGGNDYLNGGPHNDILYGGPGDDKLVGELFGEGDDELYGGPGNDRLDGFAGADVLDGGAPDRTSPQRLRRHQPQLV